MSGGELSEHFQCARFELAQGCGEILVLLLKALPALKTLIKLPAEVCDLGFKSRDFGRCVPDAPL